MEPKFNTDLIRENEIKVRNWEAGDLADKSEWIAGLKVTGSLLMLESTYGKVRKVEVCRNKYASSER